MKKEYTENQNPLKLLEKDKIYRKDQSPLLRIVVDKLIRHGYLNNQYAKDSKGNNIPMFGMGYRGDIFQAKPYLKEWQFNDEDVARELEGNPKSKSFKH